jgi:hypothetical protein
MLCQGGFVRDLLAFVLSEQEERTMVTRNAIKALCLSVLFFTACGKVDGGSNGPSDGGGIDTGGEPPNPEGVALSAEPVDITTAVPANITPTVTLSARATHSRIVPNYLRDYVRGQIQFVTYPEGEPVTFTTELNSDPSDQSVAIFAIHPTSTLIQRWYAVKLPKIDGTLVGLDEQPEAPNTLEVRFHPGSDARIRFVGVCDKSDGTKTLSITFSEDVLLDSGKDPNTAFLFSQTGGATVSCKNTAVPLPGVAMDFEYRCTADQSRPLSILVNTGLTAVADGPVPTSTVTVDFAGLRPAGSGCGIYFPSL